MDSLYTAVDYICAILVTGVLGMITFSHKEHQAARLMLLVAGGLTIVRWTVWSINTESPWWIRGIIGGLLGATLLILMPALWNWSKAKITQQTQAQKMDELQTVKPSASATSQDSKEQTAQEVPIRRGGYGMIFENSKKVTIEGATIKGNETGISSKNVETFVGKKLEITGTTDSKPPSKPE